MVKKPLRILLVIGFMVLVSVSTVSTQSWTSGAEVTEISELEYAASVTPYDTNILYVAPDANCGEMTPCYNQVQEAVDAANEGDEIYIAAGTYTDIHVHPRHDITVTGYVTQMVYLSKTVMIRGGYTTTNWHVSYPVTQPAILNAQSRGRGVYITGDVSPTIETRQD